VTAEPRDEVPAILKHGGKEFPLVVVPSTEGYRGLNIAGLRGMTGMVTLDQGFANTAACCSAVSHVDGAAGELRYRGYPVEQIAERSSFCEVAYLLFHGDLPSARQFQIWNEAITRHTLLHDSMSHFFEAFPRDADPMAVLSSATTALSTFYPTLMDPRDPAAIEQGAIRLLAKLPTVAAFAYRRAVGLPYAFPKNSLDYAARFMHMMFSLPTEEYSVDPSIARALDVVLMLHADHAQSCSTTTVRLVGSGRANLFASVAAGINALSGPLHGAANRKVLEMLEHIRDAGGNHAEFLERAKDHDDPFRLWGFGHRVYKSYDPRARILKDFAYQVIDRLGRADPLLDIARALEDAALHDDYFIERNLYPNLDFYSGITFRALGFPADMFTALFALGRLPGWIAQWKEMAEDPDTRIGRPAQVYVGHPRRDYPGFAAPDA
jgi:citrate synthase